ncbi:piggyBac transposable element-derived protein 4-like, partial [Stegodyphus dumicola]|uniref:piggyBac transposable element-derived protein 4-like n=1 Tax=Stegodyphus dumicola TaxID=202533 RepID=UPI0015A909CD
MSRNRFLLLLRALHFAKIPDQNTELPKDRLHKVRDMVNLFNARVSEIYYPGCEISLDELMVLWRGRLIFRQYIPNKRHKYGIKLHMITTPGGMVLKFMIYTGMLDDSDGKEHAKNVVMNLLVRMLDVGHSIFMDNYCNSYELSKCLTDKKTHCTGTIRKNRKTFPKE